MLGVKVKIYRQRSTNERDMLREAVRKLNCMKVIIYCAHRDGCKVALGWMRVMNVGDAGVERRCWVSTAAAGETSWMCCAV